MYVEMVCNCEASMSIDVDQNSELLWSFATRFAAAHVKCGYIAHDRNSWESDFTKDINLIIKEGSENEDEEDEEEEEDE